MAALPGGKLLCRNTIERGYGDRPPAAEFFAHDDQSEPFEMLQQAADAAR